MRYQLALDQQHFLTHFWQQRPCVFTGALAPFTDPITADELAGLALEQEVDSRLVSQRHDQWQVQHGPFTDFSHLGEKNWSLLVQAANHWHPACHALMQPFRFLPDWRVDDLMISFSTPGGGVGPHVDQYDVFIIQGMGRRRWRVGEATDVKPLPTPHPDLLQVAPFKAIIDEELQAGDVLYIPPGFPHEGWSLENALNYSVGFRAPSACELISGFADRLIAHDEGGQRYHDPALSLRSNAAEVLPAEIDALQQLMLETLQQPERFRDWLGHFLSQSRHELDIAPPSPLWCVEQVQQALSAGHQFTRVAGLRSLVLQDGIYVNGQRMQGAPSAILQLFARHQQITQSHLPPAPYVTAFLAQLVLLINQGYWFLDANAPE